MDDKIRWMFIEYIAQRNIDDINDSDMTDAIMGCSYLDFTEYDEWALKAIWNEAVMDVAYP